MKECVGFILAMIIFIAGMAIGQWSLREKFNYEITNEINKQERKVIAEKIKQKEICEERIYYILLQFEYGMNKVWSTADGIILIKPRKTKRRIYNE